VRQHDQGVMKNNVYACNLILFPVVEKFWKSVKIW